ncbi:hypothetical protein [Spiroplasma endosymbiont of Labia minor]|uniref:hypothetical protein n=1 Tax=Spiroplasma endosymbiont of Labia minor TaxID=3066305 RepID=UPI0030D0B859
MTVYAKAENQLFPGVINLDVTVKYNVIVDWSALNNLLISLDLNINAEDPTINDIINKQDVIYKKINNEINQIKNSDVFFDAFNSLKWNIAYPDRILSDNNGVYKVNQVNFSAIGNDEYKDATFNINLVIYVIRDNIKYNENYEGTLSESSNRSNKNENFQKAAI